MNDSTPRLLRWYIIHIQVRVAGPSALYSPFASARSESTRPPNHPRACANPRVVLSILPLVRKFTPTPGISWMAPWPWSSDSSRCRSWTPSPIGFSFKYFLEVLYYPAMSSRSTSCSRATDRLSSREGPQNAQPVFLLPILDFTSSIHFH